MCLFLCLLQETRLWIPFLLIGGVFLLVLVSMIGAYIVDPVGIHDSKKVEECKDKESSKTFENVLVALLFFFILFTVNTEMTYSSEYAFGEHPRNQPSQYNIQRRVYSSTSHAT